MRREDVANERVPERIALLEGRGWPPSAITQTKRDARRPTQPRATMHYDALGLRPRLDEPYDGLGVFGTEDDALTGDGSEEVEERETQHGRELVGETCFFQVRIRD